MRHAIGYLDGGSISMLVAAIGGGMAGIGVFLRVVWRRLIGRLRKDSDSPTHSS